MAINFKLATGPFAAFENGEVTHTLVSISNEKPYIYFTAQFDGDRRDDDEDTLINLALEQLFKEVYVNRL